MASPRPMMVTTLTAKIDTSVTSANARSAVNAPRIAVTPMASGSEAAAKLPKISTSSTSRIGMEIVSARAMSALTRSLMSWLMTALPPICVCRPGTGTSARTAAMASPSSTPSANCSTA